MMIGQELPTAENLIVVKWLGRSPNGVSGTPVGSGVVIHHQDGEYLATALHVARECGFQPLVRQRGLWLKADWLTVGVDEQADIAVLKTPVAGLSHLTPKYGIEGALFGGIGRALGFPALGDPKELSHITELDGVPLPLTTLISTYLGGEGSKETGIHYLGGYVNSGFSGGAIIFPTQEGWTIAGIITHREGVLREHTVFSRNKETGKRETIGEIFISEPSGIIRFTDIRVPLEIIERNP